MPSSYGFHHWPRLISTAAEVDDRLIGTVMNYSSRLPCQHGNFRINSGLTTEIRLERPKITKLSNPGYTANPI